MTGKDAKAIAEILASCFADEVISAEICELDPRIEEHYLEAREDAADFRRTYRAFDAHMSETHGNDWEATLGPKASKEAFSEFWTNQHAEDDDE